MTDPLKPIKVLLVEDHQVVAQALQMYLDRRDDIDVIGIAASLADLTAFDAQPEVILMDYGLPDGTGAEGTRIAKGRWPRVGVVMLSGSASDEATLETLQAGADAYLTKGGALQEVVAAVRTVGSGATMLTPGLIREMVERLAQPPQQAPLSQALTPREHETLRLLAAGTSSARIAAELHISPATVRTHVQAIRRKLGARTRLEAVVIALGRGLIQPPPQSPPPPRAPRSH
jgi:two-component system nitrate/nitrite response regulator NarL